VSATQTKVLESQCLPMGRSVLHPHVPLRVRVCLVAPQSHVQQRDILFCCMAAWTGARHAQTFACCMKTGRAYLRTALLKPPSRSKPVLRSTRACWQARCACSISVFYLWKISKLKFNQTESNHKREQIHAQVRCVPVRDEAAASAALGGVRADLLALEHGRPPDNV
jgi:hypothetical protein